jgi:hypothetical protein
MHIDTMTMARARLALREAIRYHLFDPNVGLVDFGHPEHDGQIAWNELAIRIHVQKKLSEPMLEAASALGLTSPIPPFIGGFPTDVPEGVYRPHTTGWGGWWSPRAPNLHQSLNNPMHGGISISDEFHNAAGTLGAKVIDRATGAAMILSNWHVLVAEWTARPGQRIYQPGRLDGGTLANVIATLTRDAMSVNIDAAVATLTGSRDLMSDQLELGAVTGVGQAALGMEVTKSGRTSGVTSGVVTAIQGTAKITYSSVIARLIRGVVTIEPRFGFGQVSAPGDSGSLWINPETKQGVGLHFAGSDFPERGLAIDLRSVLDALNVDLAIDRPPVAARSFTPAPATRGAPAAVQHVGRQEEELVMR